MGFRDEVNPSVIELRKWAVSGAPQPIQDWDLVVSLLEPASDLLDLVDEGCSADFFLRCLYIRAGDLVRSHRGEQLRPLVELAIDRQNLWTLTWARRSAALLSQPETLDYHAWCDGGLSSTPDGA